MMKAPVKPLEIIHSAKSKGLNLFVDQGRLAMKKDKDASLPPELIQLIKDNKPELIHFLENEMEASSKVVFESIKPIPIAANYPLSNAQRRLWYACQIEEASIAHNMSNTIDLNGKFDVDCFRRSIHSLIERHEILRTVFRMDEEGEIRQLVLSSEALGFAIDYQDYREAPDQESAWQSYVLEDAGRAFDLSEGPLIRAALLQLSADRYVFYYNLHHLVSDGWSMELLARDVMAYYTAYTSGQEASLPPLKIQYKDYASWQLAQLSSPDFARHRDYWLSQFAEEVEVLDLPSERKRPLVKSYAGQSIGIWLSSEVTTAMRRFSSEKGGSLFIGLLAAWKVLLSRYTGVSDLVVGCPVEGRDHPDLSDQIGCYLNALALRNKLDPTASFEAFYDQVKMNTLTAYEHQSYAFDKLVKDLELQRDPSRNPLFDIIVNYHGVAAQEVPGNYSPELTYQGRTTIKFDLELHLTEGAQGEGGVYLLLNYNSSIYDRQMVEGLLVHYKQLLSLLMSNPSVEVGKVDFLSVGERQYLLEEYNATAVSYPTDQTVLDLFKAQVEATPEGVALVYGSEEWSYQELDERSTALAHRLRSSYGLQVGDHVGLHMERSGNFVVAVLGILKSGGVYVPIDRNYPLLRKEYIVEDAEIALLIGSSEEELEIEFYDGDYLAIDEDYEAATSTSELPEVESTALAYVIYTSGSTGQPKGVMIEHRSLLNYLMWAKDYYLGQALRNRDFGLFTSPSFDLTITSLFLPLLSGGSLRVYEEELETLEILGLYLASGASCIKLTPSHISLLSGLDQAETNLELAIVGGEALQDHHIGILRKLNPAIKIYNEYGPTEATVGCIVEEIKEEDSPIYIGRPIANTEVYILDESGVLVPRGVNGELYIGGSGLARGYRNRSELTAARFIASPFKSGERLYKTGDIGRMTESGAIVYQGRKDHQVKLRGYRIELEEIESVLNELSNVEQSVVEVVKDASGTAQLVAYVVSKELVDITSLKEGLMLVLEEQLPEYMVPQLYVSLEEMPLTTNGKIDRRALPMPDAAAYQVEEYVAPVSREEKVLAKAWESILGQEQIGTKANFYTMGGDSIKAIQLLNYLRKTGYELKVRDAAQNPVLADMARVIKYREEEIFYDLKPLQRTPKTVTRISANQKYFIHRPYAVILSNVLSLNAYSEEALESQLLDFFAAYPSLLAKFEKNAADNTILQRYTLAKQTSLEIKFLKPEEDLGEWQAQDIDQLRDKARAYLKRPFDYFSNAPLIRVFVVPDPSEPTRAYLSFGIAHALVDVDTFALICEDFTQRFGQARESQHHFTNFDFALWQHNFLNTSQGKKQRDWWLEYLQSSPFDKTEPPQAPTFEAEEFIAQHYSLIGPQFAILEEKADALNVPLSALILAMYQSLLYKLEGESVLQAVALNGGDLDYGGDQDDRVMGLTTNFLPLRIETAQDPTSPEYIAKVYTQYLEVRLHQKVPFEVIREDFLNHHQLDINQAIKGIFNFRLSGDQPMEPLDGGNVLSTSSEFIKQNDVYGLSMICDLYNNGIALKLLCPKTLYEQQGERLSLEVLVKNQLAERSVATSKS